MFLFKHAHRAVSEARVTWLTSQAELDGANRSASCANKKPAIAKPL